MDSLYVRQAPTLLAFTVVTILVRYFLTRRTKQEKAGKILFFIGDEEKDMVLEEQGDQMV